MKQQSYCEDETGPIVFILLRLEPPSRQRSRSLVFYSGLGASRAYIVAVPSVPVVITYECYSSWGHRLMATFARLQNSIWYKRTWSMRSSRCSSLGSGLLTAGTFGWLGPADAGVTDPSNGAESSRASLARRLAATTTRIRDAYARATESSKIVALALSQVPARVFPGGELPWADPVSQSERGGRGERRSFCRQEVSKDWLARILPGGASDAESLSRLAAFDSGRARPVDDHRPSSGCCP